MHQPVVEQSSDQTQGTPILHVLNLPSACETPFFLSTCFHKHNLPELMLSNTRVNQHSAEIMMKLLTQFSHSLKIPNGPATHIARLLTSTRFMPLTINGIQIQGADGKCTSVPLRCAVRKLEDYEEKLLLVEVYEYFIREKIMSEDELVPFVRNGISVMELADAKNLVNGQPGYDIKQISKIRSVTLQ